MAPLATRAKCPLFYGAQSEARPVLLLLLLLLRRFLLLNFVVDDRFVQGQIELNFGVVSVMRMIGAQVKGKQEETKCN